VINNDRKTRKRGEQIKVGKRRNIKGIETVEVDLILGVIVIMGGSRKRRRRGIGIEVEVEVEVKRRRIM